MLGPEETVYFRKVLNEQLEKLSGKAEDTITGMETAPGQFADPGDRALSETDNSRDLRIRDRERKLIGKIREALERLNGGTFGICEVCEEPIDLERLKARPVTTLCIDCKRDQEEMERRHKI